MASRHSPFCATSTPKATCDFASPRASAKAGTVVNAMKESVQTRERINMWSGSLHYIETDPSEARHLARIRSPVEQAICHARRVKFQPDCTHRTPGTYET